MTDQTPAPTPRTSVEKLDTVLPQLSQIKPRNQAEEAMLQFAPMILPHVAQILPSDPLELDKMLTEACHFVAELVSDVHSHPDATGTLEVV